MEALEAAFHEHGTIWENDSKISPPWDLSDPDRVADMIRHGSYWSSAQPHDDDMAVICTVVAAAAAKAESEFIEDETEAVEAVSVGIVDVMYKFAKRPIRG